MDFYSGILLYCIPDLLHGSSVFIFLFCGSQCLSTASKAANPQPRSGHVELLFMHNNMVKYHQFRVDQLTVVFLAVFLTSRVHYCPVIIHFHSIIFFLA